MVATPIPYVRKPADIEVVIVGTTASELAEAVDWLTTELGSAGNPRIVSGMNMIAFTSTVNGTTSGRVAYEGSRIVKDSRGQIYVMTPEQLDALYYPAE